MLSSNQKRTALALGLAVLLVHGAFAGGLGWNQAARLGAIFTFVEPGPDQGTFRIDSYVGPASSRGLTTTDWARAGGHFYPNKAPGTIFLGLPVYAVLFQLERELGAGPDSPEWTSRNAYLLNLALGVAPTALGCAVFYLLLLGLGLLAADALASAGALAFATLLFPFDTSLWGHATTASFLLGALFCLLRGSRRSAALAGLLASFAVTTDYLSVLTFFLFAGLLAREKERRARLPSYLAGAILPAAALALYQWSLFGSPFASAFGESNPIFLGNQAGGVLGGAFDGFSPLRLAKLLFFPARGLFVYCPILLFTFLGARHLRARAPALFILSLAQVTLTLLFLASFEGWHGGWSSGPRYLVPSLPFLCLLLPELSRLSGPWRGLYLSSGALSLLLMWMVSFTGTMAPSDLPEPFTTFFLPRLTGSAAISPEHFLLFPGHFWAARLASLALVTGAAAWVALRVRALRSHQ